MPRTVEQNPKRIHGRTLREWKAAFLKSFTGEWKSFRREMKEQPYFEDFWREGHSPEVCAEDEMIMATDEAPPAPPT